MHRQIYTDGRKLPEDMDPSWMGYSIGKWDGDTRVVETAGMTERRSGHPRSESTRMTERYKRRDFGHMGVQITIDDPSNYTKPFTISFNARLVPDTDVLEKVAKTNGT